MSVNSNGYENGAQDPLVVAGKRIAELEKELSVLDEQLEVYRMLANASGEAIAFFDESMKCIQTNDTALKMLGYSREEFLGKDAFELVTSDSHDEIINHVRARSSEPYQVTAVKSDGTMFPAEITARTMDYKGQNIRVTAMRDITRLKVAEEELRDALGELELIFDNSRVGIMFLKGGRVLKKGNQALADLLGYVSPDEMVGLSMRSLHLTEERFHEYGENFFYALTSGELLHIEYQLRCKDGTPVWCSLSGKAVDTRKPPDLNKGVLWVVDDITKKKKDEEKLKKQATTDELTGILNRREFFRLVDQALCKERRKGSGTAFLMLDLDHFKLVNDNLGHESGDEVLKAFSKSCGDMLRDKDIFVRLGGEEFAIFLADADLDGAIIVADRIRARVESSIITTRSGEVSITVSIGVSATQAWPVDVQEMLREADKALYSAKRNGRNRVEYYYVDSVPAGDN